MGRRKVVWVAVVVLVGGTVVTAWLASTRPGLADPVRGRQLYAAHCASCHGADGQGRVRGNATSLNNPDFLNVASDDFLRTTLARGRRGTEMPGWAREAGGPFARDDIDAVVAFLRTWQRRAGRPRVPRVIGGDVARGRGLYMKACANCHGWEGRGELVMGPAVTNPDLLAAADDAFLWATIAYGRRDTPMFPSLRGLDGVRQLSEQEISDVVTYLRSQEKRESGATR